MLLIHSTFMGHQSDYILKLKVYGVPDVDEQSATGENASRKKRKWEKTTIILTLEPEGQYTSASRRPCSSTCIRTIHARRLGWRGCGSKKRTHTDAWKRGTCSWVQSIYVARPLWPGITPLSNCLWAPKPLWSTLDATTCTFHGQSKTSSAQLCSKYRPFVQASEPSNFYFRDTLHQTALRKTSQGRIFFTAFFTQSNAAPFFEGV
jgi:hypothetical protein